MHEKQKNNHMHGSSQHLHEEKNQKGKRIKSKITTRRQLAASAGLE
jgi:hypothetical protein